MQLNNIAQNINLDGVPDDVKKALEAYGATGGKYYPAFFDDGSTISMCERVAFLEGEETLAKFNDKPIIVSNTCGKGKVIYCGSNLGEGCENDKTVFENFLCKIIKSADVAPNMGIKVKGVHIDVISDNLIAVNNISEQAFELNGVYKSVFFDNVGNFVLPKSADIFMEV